MSDLKGDVDVKKMVKQVITFDDGTETIIHYNALGEKVAEAEPVEEEEKAPEPEAPEEVPAEEIEEGVVFEEETPAETPSEKSE